MPMYNCEKFVARSIESLLAQTFSDFELVISDNASTDGGEEICRAYAARDARIRYVRRETNIGGPGNFRYVFSLCRGEYHKWSTADDYWDPTFVAKAVAVLDADPSVVLCYPKTRLIDADDALLEDYEDNLHLLDPSPRHRFNTLLATIGLCNAHLGVIRRSAMNRTRLIGPQHTSDVHFLAELSLFGKFFLLPEYLFFRRFHTQSSSWNRADVERQLAYYAPNRKDLRMHAWRKIWLLGSAAWRAPIPARERFGLTADVARLASWEREALARELVTLVTRSR